MTDEVWTAGRFQGFVASALRAAFRKYPVKWAVLSEAFRGKKLNPKTGKQAGFYQCKKCKQEFIAKEVQVDHKQPVVDLSGFVDWNTYVDRLFCDAENLQVLCVSCHKDKSKKEAAIRAIKRKELKDGKTKN